MHTLNKLNPHALALLASLVLSACEHGEPPAPAGPLHRYGMPDAEPASTHALSATARTMDTGPHSAPVASATVTTSASDASLPLAIMASDGALPQTKTKPSRESALLQARARALFEAIQRDDASLALPFFFPKEAYEQVKAIPNPASDWKRRLVSAFDRDIHALHARVTEGDTFVSIDIPEAQGRWVDVDEETNRIGYYRVFGSKLRYKHGDGDEQRTIDLKSLISWRGEYYVVHLSAFK